MRKVNCIVVYTKKEEYYILNNITVKHKNNNITLYSDKWDYIDKMHAYKYYKFNDLYKTVLDFLKSNNFYVHTWKEFNTVFYNIDFIDTNDFIINRYAYN